MRLRGILRRTRTPWDGTRTSAPRRAGYGRLLVLAAAVLPVAGAGVVRLWPSEPGPCRQHAPRLPSAAVPASVARVVDGDTFVTTAGETVRLLGINAPESVDPRRPPEHYGSEAAAFLRRKLQGRRVRVLPGRAPVDAYGRTLAWIWTEGGEFVNAELVRQGTARVATYPDNPEFRDLLLLCEREARGTARGLWGP